MKLIISCLIIIFTSPGYADEVNCAKDLSASAPLLDTALHNLQGLKYVHEAFSSLPPDAEICTSGIVLAQDIYQYAQFYIQADVRSSVDHTLYYQARFLFQDASTQALQNMVKQPWTVLMLDEADAILNTAFQGATAKPAVVRSTDPLLVARSTATYAAASVQESTLMSLPLGEAAGLHETHLVTWLTQSGQNLFASTPQTKAVLVGSDNQGQTLVIENLWPYSDLLTPLTKSLNSHWPADGDDLKQTLLNFSQKKLAGRIVPPKA